MKEIPPLAPPARPGGPARAGLALAALLAAGCATSVYQPSRSVKLDLDGGQEINDEDVRKAFEARPQLRDRLQLAYFSIDPRKAAELEEILKALPGVTSVYRIPALVVTGQRRYDEPSPWEPSREVGIKKLRLLAARAGADVLVVLDHGHRVETSGNRLSPLAALVLPVLFVPFLDVSAKSYLEAHVIDVRNGYLYGEVSSEEQGVETYRTIYGAGGEDMLDAEWLRLRAATAERLARLFQDERAASRAAPPPPPAPRCPPAGAAPAPPPPDRPAALDPPASPSALPRAPAALAPPPSLPPPPARPAPPPPRAAGRGDAGF